MLRYFRTEGSEFTVVNASDVEFRPTIPNADPPNNLCGRELRRAIWLVQRCPELAYMLKSFDCESALLASLQVNPKHIAIIRRGNRWVLDPVVVEAWAMLESHLLCVTDTLLQHVANRDEYCFPFDAYWPNPTECGYKQEWADQQVARSAAYRSLDACRVLLARCSMAIALASPDLHDCPAHWKLILLQNDILARWVEHFQTSIIPDFSPCLRVGAYVSPADNEAGTTWIRHVPCMVRANLPVYIFWPKHGRDEIVAKYPFLRQYLPVPELIVDVPDASAENCFGWKRLAVVTASSGSHSGQMAGAMPDSANIPHGPGQRAGESALEFFARREAANRTLELKETEAQRESRLPRAWAASSFARPMGRARATVYLWTTIGDHDPTVQDEWFELDYREVLGHRRLAETWDLYPKVHKRYDPFRNEWDICPLLVPQIEPRMMGDEEDDDDDDTPGADTSVDVPSQPHGTPSSLADSFARDLHRVLEEIAVGFHPMLEPLHMVATKAYGLAAQVVEDPSLPYEKYSATAIAKKLGFYVEDEPTDPGLYRRLSALVASLETDEASPRASGCVWDLASTSYDYVLYWPHPSMHVDQVSLNRSLWYRINYQYQREDGEFWALVVNIGTTVLELYRHHEIATTRDAARFLVKRGIAFHTLAPRHTERILHERQEGLGIRPAGYVFTPDDYRVYLHRVRCLLSRSKARAALLLGGIVWRIAVEVLGDDAAELACAGPSTEAYESGSTFRPQRGDDWVDDALSPEELDLICGVYQLYDGM